MKILPPKMAARIESGAARLCHVWILHRPDGLRLGFTDHDADLVVDQTVCRAASGWTTGAGEAAVGLSPGTVSAAGGLDDEALTEADIAAGLYDRARAELWRVDWEQPQLRVNLWVGQLTRIRREGNRFVADLSGPMDALERVIGRIYARNCDALFGDARCRVKPELLGRGPCDKRWRTCVQKFGNGDNFRGFPDIPGDDFILQRARPAGQNDGGSRR